MIVFYGIESITITRKTRANANATTRNLHHLQIKGMDNKLLFLGKWNYNAVLIWVWIDQVASCYLSPDRKIFDYGLHKQRNNNTTYLTIQKEQTIFSEMFTMGRPWERRASATFYLTRWQFWELEVHFNICRICFNTDIQIFWEFGVNDGFQSFVSDQNGDNWSEVQRFLKLSTKDV